MNLKRFNDGFISNKWKGMLVLEWHWNSKSFSVLDKYDISDKLLINKIWEKGIDIDYKKLVDIIIERQKVKDLNKDKTIDTILFAACEWDYAINFYRELNDRKDELGSNFIPPIMVTAAEAGQSWLGRSENLDTEIPGELFKYTLDIWWKNKTTFWTFFKNQHLEEMWSNPNLFYPVKINWKRTPQQLW